MGLFTGLVCTLNLSQARVLCQVCIIYRYMPERGVYRFLAKLLYMVYRFLAKWSSC